jgi:hypothetical protein
MNERDFTDRFCGDLEDWMQRFANRLVRGEASDSHLGYRVAQLKIIPSQTLHTGATLGWSYTEGQYTWTSFRREVDVVIGSNEGTTSHPDEVIPLFVFELKSQSFNSDDLDKTSAIYSGFRDVYPWVTRIFVHENMAETRDLHDNYLFKNARGFDFILTEWSSDSGASSLSAQESLEHMLEAMMRYYVSYWGF